MTKITFQLTTDDAYWLDMARILLTELHLNGYVNHNTGAVESRCNGAKLHEFMEAMHCVRPPATPNMTCSAAVAGA